MLKKKVKVLLASLVTISMVTITIISSNVYASPNKIPDKEVSATFSGDKKSAVGTLQSPADSSANEITETKLDGNPIMFQSVEYYYDNNNKKVENAEGNIIEITPLSTITWSDQTIDYNTRMHFTRSGSTFIIRKGVTARFSFYITSGNSNYECGFMDKNLNVLEVLNDDYGVGGSFPYTPSSDVEGYFYIWNKSADSIGVKDIELSY